MDFFNTLLEDKEVPMSNVNAVSNNLIAASYVSGQAASQSSDESFSSVLSSQLASDESAAETSGDGSEELLLTSYSSGQQAAYEVDLYQYQGWPAAAGQEWTPTNMSFYDEATGQWTEDNIPHRINENGELEYQWEGEWYLDTAVRHRVATSDSETEGDSGAEGQVTISLDANGPFTDEEYYNATLGDWRLFNLPYRETEYGEREYYWGDQWWQATWEYRQGSESA